MTRYFKSVGEMIDAKNGRPSIPPAVERLRAAGAFQKPEGDDPKKGARNPTNVGNPCPKGPSGQKQAFRNEKNRKKAERKAAARNSRRGKKRG